MKFKNIAGLGAGSLYLFAAQAHAGAVSITGQITFAPVIPPTVMPDAAAAPTPVPVMADTLLIALGLLLIVAAIRFLRSNQNAQKIMSFVMLATGTALGALGTIGIDNAHAINSGPLPVLISDSGCDGTTINTENASYLYSVVENDCDSKQEIKSINVDLPQGGQCSSFETESPITDPGVPVCSEGLILTSGEECYGPTYLEIYNCPAPA